MKDIMNKALEILVDDGGLDCLKDALKKAIKDTKPTLEVTPRIWNSLFQEMLLTVKEQRANSEVEEGKRHTRQTYTIPQDRREEVEKLVAKYQRKAVKYGATMTVEYGEPYAKRVPVSTYDPATNCYIRIDEQLVEVFDLTVDGDEIRKDGYTVVAKIEHLEGGNIVNAFGGAAKQAWRESKGHCEHCNSRRDRRLTFIVRHEDGSEKQVGRTCLKDYCGIDPQAIGYRNELNEILLNDDIATYDFESRPVSPAYSTIEVLALALRTIKAQGYVKSGEPNSNKGKIAESIKGARFTEDEKEAAQKLANSIAAIDREDAIDANLGNVQTLIESRYCKANHFGYLAYAPIAYEKYLAEMERRKAREAARNAQKEASNYVGEVGKRIDLNITEMKLLTSWETQWGMTWLYRFVDTNGNVLVWFASKPMERVNENGVYEDVTEVNRIRATVKEHSERDGVKQTIITRCKIA